MSILNWCPFTFYNLVLIWNLLLFLYGFVERNFDEVKFQPLQQKSETPGSHEDHREIQISWGE